MNKILTQNLYLAEQVRALEKKAALNSGCDLFTLMQRAGHAVYDHCALRFPQAQRYSVLVGVGNNAGDGFIAALRAKQEGKSVSVVSVDPTRCLSGDAGRAQQQWIDAGGAIQPFSEACLAYSDLLIDALLGTGIQGNPRLEYQPIISAINRSDCPTISIDVPSGLNASTGEVYASCVNADMTVTLIVAKAGLVTGMGKHVTGELIVADLGVGSSFAEMAMPFASIISQQNVTWLKARATHSHKGAYGRLLCIGGNRGMGGAIRLSSEAAMRAGAGLLKAFVHSDSVMQVAAGRPELMVMSDNLERALDWCSAIVIGPGLGQDSWGQDVLVRVLGHVKNVSKPIIIDADGLNLLAQQTTSFVLDQVVLTPHTAEASRLLGVSVKDVDADRYRYASQCAKRYHAVVVMKGAGSIVADGEALHVCAAGNPVLATAGSGDVLAGLVGALLAQGMAARDAAATAVVLHATAADEIAANHGQYGMMASDLFPVIRKLINQQVEGGR